MQIIYCLHIRALQCRGRVSRPEHPVFIDIKGKRNFGYWFVQIFYCLLKRVLYCRGGVSPPVTPSLSIFGQNKLRLFYCIPFAYRFQGATLLLIFSSLFSQKIPHKRDFLLFEVKTVFFEYLHCKALSLPSFSFNSVRIFS